MDKRFSILLNDFHKVQSFMKKVLTFDCDIDLISGRYTIDAKSTMGVFTLNLINPFDVEIQSNDENEIKRFNEEMEAFRVWEK